MVGGQNGYRVRVPWNNFTFGWEHTADKSVDKRGAEKHTDSQIWDNAGPDSDTEKPKTDGKDYLSFVMLGLFDVCS